MSEHIPRDERTDQNEDRPDAIPFEALGQVDGERNPEGHPVHDAKMLRVESRNDTGAEDQDRRQRKPHQPREHGCPSVEKQHHQHHQRQQQVPLGGNRAPWIRAFRLGQPVQAGATGLEMHHPERRDVIEQRGDDRSLDYGDVGDTERLGHDERDCAHHRRHDLPTHARGRFDGAGEHRGVAETLHQRNGERPDSHHVGDTRAGDRAHQAG